MPVCNYDGEVIGVAQIINKRGGSNNHEFTETDLKVSIIYAFLLDKYFTKDNNCAHIMARCSGCNYFVYFLGIQTLPYLLWNRDSKCTVIWGIHLRIQEKSGKN